MRISQETKQRQHNENVVCCFMTAKPQQIITFFVYFTEELELLGGPGYEMARRNLDMMDSLMHEVQEFYENWTKRLDEMTLKHEEQQRQQAKQKK